MGLTTVPPGSPTFPRCRRASGNPTSRGEPSTAPPGKPVAAVLAEPVRFVTLVGNPRPGSRTLTVAAVAAEAIALALRLDPDYEIIDLSVLARRLLLPGPSVAVEDAAELVSGGGQHMPVHAVTRSARWARDLSRWSGGNGGNPMCWRSELGTADQS